MPSPQSSRANLDKARREGRVIFWRRLSESQRVKAEIVWLHETEPRPSQRAIGRMLHVSQPYVARVLKRVRLSGCDIERALGPESYRRYRALLEGQRRAHFQAQGGPASLIGEGVSASSPAFEVAQAMPPTAAAGVKAPRTEYVERMRTTDDQIIEGHGSKPAYALTGGELHQFRNPRPIVDSGIPLNWVLDPRVSRCDLSLWFKAKHSHPRGPVLCRPVARSLRGR